MPNFTNPSPFGHTNGEELFAEEFDPIAEAMPKIPNFAEGSEHTPTDPVRVLGSEGMMVETFRAGTGFGDTPELRNLARSVPFLLSDFVPSVDGANWSFSGNVWTCVVATVSTIYAFARVPPNTTILAASIWYQGDAHGGSWPPATMPTLEAHKLNAETGSAIQLGNTKTEDASQIVYEANHNLVADLDGDPECLFADFADMLRLTFRTEGGANAVALTGIRGATLYRSLTQVPL